MAAGQIATQLGIPAATLSFHLKELTHAGLIDQRREGRFIIHTLNVAAMRSLLGYLMEDCCQGRPELCQSDYSEACCDEGAKASKPRRKKRKTAR